MAAMRALIKTCSTSRVVVDVVEKVTFPISPLPKRALLGVSFGLMEVYKLVCLCLQLQHSYELLWPEVCSQL